MVVSYGLIKMTECWCIPFMVNIIRASILKCALAEQHYLTQCQEQLDQTWWIVNFQMWWWNIALLFTPLPAFCMYCIDVGQSSGSAGVKWGQQWVILNVQYSSCGVPLCFNTHMNEILSTRQMWLKVCDIFRLHKVDSLVRSPETQ